MTTQIDNENADLNITTLTTVLTATPGTVPTICQALVNFGDGTKNLDGTGGDFQIVITVGGQTVEPSPQVVTFSTAVRAAVFTTIFPVPASAEVVVKVLSPNAADTDVDVDAYLYVLNPLQSTVLGNTLDVTATGAAGIDWGNVENKSTANDLSQTDIQLCDTVTTNADMRGTDSAALASVWTVARAGALTDWIDGGRLDLILDDILLDTGTTIPAGQLSATDIVTAGPITTLTGAVVTVGTVNLLGGSSIQETSFANMAITDQAFADDALPARVFAADFPSTIGMASANMDTQLATIAAVTTKLDTGLELDGLVYRWTANALEQAPTGSGGSGSGSGNNTVLRARIVDDPNKARILE